MSAPFVKLDQPLDEYAVICRGCLTEAGEMKNMFEWGLADDFFKFGGTQRHRSEGISELICTACEDLLRMCQRFRNQCQDSDTVLRDIAKRRSKQTPVGSNEENSVTTVATDRSLTIRITAPDTNSKIYLPCPYCKSSYIKQNDLLTHLVKSHQIDKAYTIDVQYYCSFDTCSYYLHGDRNKHFQGRKFLNQHYVKVHMKKLIDCDKCATSFATNTEFERHLKSCNVTFQCQSCGTTYKSRDKLTVHLMRKHPELHKRCKEEKRAYKRKFEMETVKKPDIDRSSYVCDSPKRSFATQTIIENGLCNDVALPLWQTDRPDSNYGAKTDEISTQTVFEDLLSLKSQTSEEESIFFSETVSLSDIQTQTFPVEFGLSRSNKETWTSETQSPDLSIKETQTCLCLYDASKINYKIFDSIPLSANLTSTETQTADFKSNLKSDVMLSSNSTQTQTCFQDNTIS